MARTAALADDRRLDSILLELTLNKLQYFSAELAKLRVAVAELSGISKGELVRGVPSSVFIGADAVGPFERGFYAREYDNAGRPYRWTGDGDFVELRFFINRNVASRFNLAGFLPNNATLGAVRAFVDYSPVATNISYDGQQFVVSGELPPCPFETRAVVTLWSLGRFTSAEQNGDTRSLWFVFSEFAVDPVEEAAANKAAVGEAPTADRQEQPAEKATAISGEFVPITAVPNGDEITPISLDGVMPVSAEVISMPVEETDVAARDTEPTGVSKRNRGEAGSRRAASSRRRR